MGIIRTLLALSVVLYHSWPGELFVGGANAVRLFYTISGFLISFILMESKRYNRVRDFYLSRYLRLFPVYFVVALTTLILYQTIGNDAFFATFANAPFGATVLLSLSNLAILGQDWVLFLGANSDGYFLARNFTQGQAPLWFGLLLPQAWSLSLELCFYAIAPFVLSKRRLLFGLFFASIAVRVALYVSGVGTTDPWTYRFFPSELSLFLAGSIAHQTLRPFYNKWFAQRTNGLSTIATFAMCSLIVFFPLVPIEAHAKDLLLLALFVIALPLLFSFQCNHIFDAKLGELSYPIYVVHVLVIWICTKSLPAFVDVDQKTISIVATIASIFAAALLVRCVAKPIERFRTTLKHAKA